jgi:hypothetical protein
LYFFCGDASGQPTTVFRKVKWNPYRDRPLAAARLGRVATCDLRSGRRWATTT